MAAFLKISTKPLENYFLSFRPKAIERIPQSVPMLTVVSSLAIHTTWTGLPKKKKKINNEKILFLFVTNMRGKGRKQGKNRINFKKSSNIDNAGNSIMKLDVYW